MPSRRDLVQRFGAIAIGLIAAAFAGAALGQSLEVSWWTKTEDGQHVFVMASPWRNEPPKWRSGLYLLGPTNEPGQLVYTVDWLAQRDRLFLSSDGAIAVRVNRVLPPDISRYAPGFTCRDGVSDVLTVIDPSLNRDKVVSAFRSEGIDMCEWGRTEGLTLWAGGRLVRSWKVSELVPEETLVDIPPEPDGNGGRRWVESVDWIQGDRALSVRTTEGTTLLLRVRTGRLFRIETGSVLEEQRTAAYRIALFQEWWTCDKGWVWVLAFVALVPGALAIWRARRLAGKPAGKPFRIHWKRRSHQPRR